MADFNAGVRVFEDDFYESRTPEQIRAESLRNEGFAMVKTSIDSGDGWARQNTPNSDQTVWWLNSGSH